MEKKILFLDFDGVLFDTLKEVYLVNRYLYKGIDFLEEIDKTSYERFSKYKYLVYNIWMFLYYNPIIFSDIVDVEAEFKLSLQNRNEKREQGFCFDLLTTRENLVANHHDFWENLEEPYQFFFEIKKLYEENKIKMVVASKKNKQAILQRFSNYGLNFNPDDVYAREILDNYKSKGEFIKEYLDKYNYTSAMFVDDNNNNLIGATDSRIETILALWGNPQPNIKGYTEAEGIKKVIDYCSSI